MSSAMEKIARFSFVFILLLIGSQLSKAQTHEGYYMHVDYIHIQKDDIPEFEEHIASILKPGQEERMNEESFTEWYIYRVAYPSLENPTYNYVVVSLSETLDEFDNVRTQVFSHMSDYMADNFKKMLVPNRSELWRINNSVLTSDSTRASKYFIMDYMDVTTGMEYAYQMMEDEIALPIHEYRMEIDQMNGWELFSLIVPGGTEYGYNFATGNYFSDLRHFEFGFTEEIIRQSHPETDINEINQNIERTRNLVRSEVWELIDFVK